MFSRVRRSGGVQGLSIIVQSDRDPVVLEARILAFLDSVEVKERERETVCVHVCV